MKTLSQETVKSVCDLGHEFGHMEAKRTLALLRDRCYWPHMAGDAKTKCDTCAWCAQHKTLPSKMAYLHTITSSKTSELVCIDFLSTEASCHNGGNILAVTDHFTRYAQAYPTQDQKASTVAQVLWDKYFPQRAALEIPPLI